MLKNKNPDANWKAGDICYVYERWSQSIVKTKISRIDKTEMGTIAVTNHGNRPLDELFHDLKTGRDALAEENEKLKAKYAAEMTDVASIVAFAWNNCISNTAGEYTDWEARVAFKEQVKNIIGIDLP